MESVKLTQPWSEFGLAVSTESVQEQVGEHATDRRIVNDHALIATVVNVATFVETFGEPALMKFINGTSLRVTCQRIARSMAKERDTAKVEVALLNAIRSVRNAVVQTRTVIVHALPNGTTYDGTDLVEFQQEYAAALIDAGVPGDVALNIAKLQTL